MWPARGEPAFRERGGREVDVKLEGLEKQTAGLHAEDFGDEGMMMMMDLFSEDLAAGVGKRDIRGLDSAAEPEEEVFEAKFDASGEEDNDAWCGVREPDAGVARLTFEHVLELLERAEAGDFDSRLPQRPQASPISPTTRCFFVTPTLKHTLSETEKERRLGSPESLIAVKYQGFSNGELWWSPRHGLRKGVVARNMTRKARNPKSTAEHGFAGRWYTLIQRPTSETAVSKFDCRSHIVFGAPSMVQFWPAPELGQVHTVKKRRRVAEAPAAPDTLACGSFSSSSTSCSSSVSRGSLSDTSETDSQEDGASRENQAPSPRSDGSNEGAAPGALPAVEQSALAAPRQVAGSVIFDHSISVNGDCVVNGDLSARNLHVRGKLTVDGGIHGQIITPPNAADYAEWFPCLDSKEDIRAGHVVQLRSPEQRLTLDTSGAGPIMVVSTTPSVAAGVPLGGKEAEGRLVAFIGQVPVRCVGPIRCGDHLMPSGNGDGLAVAGDSRHTDCEPIATAMTDCGPGVHEVNSFVRWPYNQDWNVRRSKAQLLSTASIDSWRLGAFFLLYLALRCACAIQLGEAYEPRTVLLSLELSHMLVLFSRFPVYPEFAWRDFWIGSTLYSIDLIYTAQGLMSELLFAGAGEVAEAPVSLAEIRALLLRFVMAQTHIVFVLLALRNHLRARAAILGLPAEVARQADWKKKLSGNVFRL